MDGSLPVQTSRGCNSQDSLGTIVTKVFSTSWQTLFSTTNGQAGVTQISLLTWSQDVLGICFLVVICLVLQSWKIKINSKINWIHEIFEMNTSLRSTRYSMWIRCKWDLLDWDLNKTFDMSMIFVKI